MSTLSKAIESGNTALIEIRLREALERFAAGIAEEHELGREHVRYNPSGVARHKGEES